MNKETNKNTEFTEKANEKIIDECKKFVKENDKKVNDYSAFKTALTLCTELINSLLESQKPFDDAIKGEIKKLDNLQSEAQKEFFVYEFNGKKMCLHLDVQAHRVLESLEDIEKNNRRI